MKKFDEKNKLKIWQQKNPILMERKKHGLTREEVAVSCAVSVCCVQQWEGGTTRPTNENLQALKKVLGDDIGRRLDSWRVKIPQITTGK